MTALKYKIYKLIEKDDDGNIPSQIVDWSIIFLILTSIASIIIESYNISTSTKKILGKIEIVTVVLFSIEYILRFWTSDFKYNKGFKNKLRYILSPSALIDLLAILPFYLPFLIKIDLRFLRMLRLFRIFRLLKLSRYIESMKIISNAIKNRKEELIITVIITLFLILFSSTLMFYIENEQQPDKFINIPSTFWWAICTLTTVGYGDIYPVTSFGKMLASVIAFLGIGLVALPTGIISSGFLEEIQKRKKEDIVCPHCGKKIIR